MALKIKDFGWSIASVALAGALGTGGYAFKIDADNMSGKLRELVETNASENLGYGGFMAAQYMVGIAIDKTFGYACFGGSALAGIAGIVSLPFRKKRLEDSLEELK